MRSDFLTALAEKQRNSTQEVLAPRGNILFSDGTTLASTQPVFLIYAQPKIIQDKTQVAQTLAQTFWEDDHEGEVIEPDEKVSQEKTLQENIFQTLSKDLFWVSLGRRANSEEKLKIEKKNLKGIGFETGSARFYPEGSSSAHVLGFVGSDIYGSETGYFGLEGFYNGELKGKDGLLQQEQDAQGVPILIGDFLVREPKPGKTLVLNIDRTIQHIVEDKLKQGLAKYSAKEASAIVMDPKTGNILAMAAYPSYDPINPGKYPKENYKNPIIADNYEPGSTFKVLVMSAAINEKLVTPDAICDICAGPVSLGGFTIRTWNNQYQPDSSMTDVIVHSDNTGMVFVSKKLGVNKMYQYIKNYGFGNLTNVDLQDEVSPNMRPLNDWREIDLATSSFGQGIAVTAMQMIKAVSAIANGGQEMEPHIAKLIKDDNKSFPIQPRIVGNPISKETAQVITEMMVKAVDKGEAQFYKKNAGLANFSIAGKTGTAQIPVAGHYDANKTIASFIGFAPAKDPKFIMLVRYREPQSSIFGAETAAPTFFDIAKELFIYYGISPQQ
ncbi:penicillin-binding protein 2 [Candidatus Daviesbacteria bacterium]|nr:penicillin-binding protein 2 [Candidatus Daviesbacteria bacterium]